MFEFASIEKETTGDNTINTFNSLAIKDLSFRLQGENSC